MATIREYFEKDFSNCIKANVHFEKLTEKIEAYILYDFTGYNAFISCYIEPSKDLQYFLNFIANFEQYAISYNNSIILPSVQNFPGQLEFSNIPNAPVNILSKFYGETEWVSSMNIRTSGRLFFYSETDLTELEVSNLKETGRRKGFEIQFRAKAFTNQINQFQSPLAFISHDSRDKQEVARKIATNLQSKVCPVWYDEFSLSVGDNLRTSIEKGLKECKKCILIISPNFLSNNGWGKTEFDSIFTRQIIEETDIVLPVWHNVNPKDVYDYSPSLANKLALNWNTLGEIEVCNKLYHAITKPSTFLTSK